MFTISAHTVDNNYLSDRTRRFKAWASARAYLRVLGILTLFSFTLDSAHATPIAYTLPVLPILVEREPVFNPEDPVLSPYALRAIKVLVIFIIVFTFCASLSVVYCILLAKSRHERASGDNGGDRGPGGASNGSSRAASGGSGINGNRMNAGSAPNLPDILGISGGRGHQRVPGISGIRTTHRTYHINIGDTIDERSFESSGSSEVGSLDTSIFPDGTIIAVVSDVERDAVSAYPLQGPELEFQSVQRAEDLRKGLLEQAPLGGNPISTVAGSNGEDQGQSQS